ncbi:MAG: P63C domain-containing protein [Desulfovibrionaceae bacterium]|nr:P63C domain-containing protein [Desulfovibrionaceae bacterium]
MSEVILKATHGSPDKPLRIGTIEIPCYVLDNGTRVISGRGMQTALGLGQSHGAKLRRFVERNEILPYINNDLAMALENPIRFIRPGRGGKLAVGFEATILADLCDAVLEARQSGALHQSQLLIAGQCEVLTRAFARVGIIALIDEATGYQEVRDRLALAAILDRYLRKEAAKWAKRFPDEFYKEMFRLREWPYDPSSVKRPGVVAKYTNDLVYQRIAPGLLQRLQDLNPKDDKGRRKHKYFQFMTEDVGDPALTQHIHALVVLMRASSNWDGFYRSVQRSLPKQTETNWLLLEIDD